ncbi:hypothetical protein HPB48_013957 [Haemaphysalis longicornis]|uniref:C2H2-type domain-containing protein n=1 Tax=Haemaphysalis longicornis TaxID=44386 RepID=A0A9J6H6G4_HAELO|nr:hypothetical protein HPB48_013957 [Haemaphysalis longicornis]
MPPRRNVARRGRKTGPWTRCPPDSESTAAADAEQSGSNATTAVAVAETCSKPVTGAKKAEAKKTAPSQKPAGPKTSAAAPPSSKKRKPATPEPVEVEDTTNGTGGEASDDEVEGDDDAAFEALVLDADDDDEGSPSAAEDQKAGGDRTSVSEDDSKPAQREENDAGDSSDGNVDAGGDAPDAETTAEAEACVEMSSGKSEAENEAADESAQNAEGEEGGEESEDVQGADDNAVAIEEDDEDEAVDEGQAAEGDDGGVEYCEEDAEGADEEGDEEEGGQDDGDYEEVECLDDSEVVDDADDAEGGEGEDAECEEAAGGDGQEDEGADMECAEQAEEDGKDVEAAGEDSTEANEDAGEEAADDSLVLEEGPADQEEGAAEAMDEEGPSGGDGDASSAGQPVEMKDEEEMVDVSQLSDLCPEGPLEKAESITVSLRHSIQRSVRLLVERLLRDAKGEGPKMFHEDSQWGGEAVYGCSLCNVRLKHPETFDCHVESTRHVKRLRWMYFMGLNKELRGEFQCRVCHIAMPCRDHLIGHLRSDRHICLSKALSVHPGYTHYLLSQHFDPAAVWLWGAPESSAVGLPEEEEEDAVA